MFYPTGHDGVGMSAQLLLGCFLSCQGVNAGDFTGGVPLFPEAVICVRRSCFLRGKRPRKVQIHLSRQTSLRCRSLVHACIVLAKPRFSPPQRVLLCLAFLFFGIDLELVNNVPKVVRIWRFIDKQQRKLAHVFLLLFITTVCVSTLRCREILSLHYRHSLVLCVSVRGRGWGYTGPGSVHTKASYHHVSCLLVRDLILLLGLALVGLVEI